LFGVELFNCCSCQTIDYIEFQRYLFLILLDAANEFLAHRHVVLQIEVVVDGTEGQRLHLFQQSQTLEALAVVFVLTEHVERLKQGLQQAFLRGAGADDVGTYSVNGSVEVVEADVGAVEGFGADDLLEQVQSLVVHDGHVVGIPTDGTTDVQHQLRHIKKQRRDLVGHILGRLVVTRVERVDDLARGAVAFVEVHRANSETLQTDAEELSLDARFHVGQWFGQNLVQRSGQNLAIAFAFHGDVLQAVVHPDVHDAWVALRLAHRVGDAAAAFGVLNPEIADFRVGIGQAQIPALGVTKRGGVEVEVHLDRLGPVDPALEMFDAHLVAVDELPAEVAIDFVQVDALRACQ